MDRNQNYETRELETAWQTKWLGLTPHHIQVQHACNQCQNWIARLCHQKEDGRTLILVGANGVGKSTLLKKLRSFVTGVRFTLPDMGTWPKPPSVMSADFPALIDDVAKVENVTEYMMEFSQCDVLFLDDVGAELDRYRSGLGIEVLRRLTGTRESKWTMLTTNIPSDAWTARWDARVNDRLLRNSVVVEMDRCPSWVEANA